MSRVAQQIKAKVLILPALILVVGAGVAIWSHGVNPDQVQVSKTRKARPPRSVIKARMAKTP